MSQLYKLKITLATTNCGEGDFDKKGDTPPFLFMI